MVLDVSCQIQKAHLFCSGHMSVNAQIFLKIRAGREQNSCCTAIYGIAAGCGLFLGQVEPIWPGGHGGHNSNGRSGSAVPFELGLSNPMPKTGCLVLSWNVNASERPGELLTRWCQKAGTPPEQWPRWSVLRSWMSWNMLIAQCGEYST